MASKKQARPAASHGDVQGYIENAGVVVEQPIVDTLETNYMPYAMLILPVKCAFMRPAGQKNGCKTQSDVLH